MTTSAHSSTQPYAVEILDASVHYVNQPFRVPLILSTGPIAELTEAQVEVVVAVNGRRAAGRGSIYLSDLWAWPDPSISHADRDAALRRLCDDMARDLSRCCGGQAAHPLELGLRLHHNICCDATPPVLARAMCASPFDAAIHDAAGIAMGVSALDLYDQNVDLPDADPYFADHNACAAIRRLIRQPRWDLPAWLVVGKNDSASDLSPWVRQRDYRCFKLKIMGRDAAADVARTVEVYRTAIELGATEPRLTVDSNEANPDAASVLDYLHQLRSADAKAFAALEYLEQPTARDIQQCPQDWR
ncbi:MAG: hypothetical protein IT440_01240, partial [Phycisphaeraceae bacterium]|nr:hypothetical protein [Phycisphaeraceae bacterium]